MHFLEKYITKEILGASFMFAIFNVFLTLGQQLASLTDLYIVLLNGTVFIFLLKYIFKFNFGTTTSHMLGYILIYISYAIPYVIKTISYYLQVGIDTQSFSDIFLAMPIVALLQSAVTVYAISLILDVKIKKTYLILLIAGVSLLILMGTNVVFSTLLATPFFSESLSTYHIYLSVFISVVLQMIPMFSILYGWFKHSIPIKDVDVVGHTTEDQMYKHPVANLVIRIIQGLIVLGAIGSIWLLGFILIFEPSLGIVLITLLSLYLLTVFRKFNVIIQTILLSIEQIILLPAVVLNTVGLFKGGYSMNDIGKIIMYFGILILPVSVIRFLRIYTMVGSAHKKKVLSILTATLFTYVAIFTFGFYKAKQDQLSKQTFFYPCGFSLEHNKEIYQTDNLLMRTMPAEHYMGLDESVQNEHFLSQSEMDKFTFSQEPGEEGVIKPDDGCRTVFSYEPRGIHKISFPNRLEIHLFENDSTKNLLSWVSKNGQKYTNEKIDDLQKGFIGAHIYEAYISMDNSRMFFSGVNEVGKKVFGYIDCLPQHTESAKQCVESLKSFKLTKAGVTVMEF